jgi:hypothetical protein
MDYSGREPPVPEQIPELGLTDSCCNHDLTIMQGHQYFGWDVFSSVQNIHGLTISVES